MAVQQVLLDIQCEEHVFLKKEFKMEVFSNKLLSDISLNKGIALSLFCTHQK